MCGGIRRNQPSSDEPVNQAIDKVKIICTNRRIDCNEEMLSTMVECFLAGMSHEARFTFEQIKKRQRQYA